MLIISRKKNESIVVNNDIVITVVEIRGDKIRLGIVAPRDAPVYREEVFEAIYGVKAPALGRPFPPVSLDPQWRTSTVVALAKEMVESRDLSAMPILADALQDAGCPNDDILIHCRDAHTALGRNSWVIDLILGKS
jgi:carbon storage regulator CsrA